MKIFLDMDGVIVNLVSSLLKKYNKDYHDSVKPEDIKSFGIHKYVKINRAIYNYFKLPGMFGEELEPFENAISVIKMIAEEYPQTYILTTPHDSSETCERDKKNWVRKHLPFFNTKNIIFSHHKHLLSKPGDIILEDKPLDLKRWKDNGGISICYNQPWNQEATCTHRVKNWYEFYHLLEAIKNNEEYVEKL